MIYGTPQLITESDSSDQIGIRTLIVSLIWQPSKKDLSLVEIDAEKPGIPSVPGGVLLVGNETRRSGGIYKTTWTFEGIDGDGKSVTFKDRSNTLDYGFEPGLSQVSLKLWRGTSGKDSNAFQELMDAYQGVPDQESDQILWQPTISSANSTPAAGLPGASAQNQGTKLNPMFGIQDFFRMEGTYRCRYAALSLPGGLYAGAGLVTSALPGQPPAVGDGRNWLKVPPVWKRRGLVFDITEEYWLSGIGGWPAPIYGGASSGSNPPGDGLSTGGFGAGGTSIGTGFSGSGGFNTL